MGGVGERCRRVVSVVLLKVVGERLRWEVLVGDVGDIGGRYRWCCWEMVKFLLASRFPR